MLFQPIISPKQLSFFTKNNVFTPYQNAHGDKLLVKGELG